MNRIRIRAISTVICVLLVAFVACKKKEEPAPAPASAVEPTMVPIPPTAAPAVNIVSVDLGNALGPDKKVAASMDTFKPKDTIFTVVSTDGSAASSTIHWKVTAPDGTTTVKEDSKTIAPTGPANTEFSIQKPSGWPKGTYTVAVSVDNGPVTTKTFTVK